MDISNYVVIGYGVFLLIMLGVNILYFFQVFKYRLPGDASVPVLVFHTILVFSVLAFSSILIVGR